MQVEQRPARREQRRAESNSDSLVPTEMTARLRPCEVNGEVSKDVNENKTKPKILTRRGERKLSFASEAW